MTTTNLATGDEQFQRLDPYAGGVSTETPRVPPLAMISAGYRQPGSNGHKGLPSSTKPGDAEQIHLHDPMGQAPGLRQILEANNFAHLLIAFPLDNPAAFISSIFTRYSSTRLEAYGDQFQITYIDNRPATLSANNGQPLHRVFLAGTPEYDRLVRTCKADTRIHFCLAEWVGDEAQVIFPDGLGIYAIRTTSSHSVRNILGTIAYTAQFTHGKIAGLPFTLKIVHRPNVTGPDGTQRQIPVWAITTQPPSGVRLSSRTFRAVATQALKEGQQLMLPAAYAPSMDEAANMGPVEIEVDEPTEEQMLALSAGGRADLAHWTRTYHAMSKGVTWRQGNTIWQLDSDEGRAAFVYDYSLHRTRSLSQYLQSSSEDEAAGLIAAVGQARTAMLSAKYDEIFQADNDNMPGNGPGKPASASSGRTAPSTDPGEQPAS